MKLILSALVGMAQWIECAPADQRVVSSIHSQGTCLGCGPGPCWVVLERQPHIDVSLPLFLHPFPSLKIFFKKEINFINFLIKKDINFINF